MVISQQYYGSTIMKFLAITAVAALYATSGFAVTRLNSHHLECKSIQNTISTEGSAIIRFSSERTPGVVLYDRFVKGQSQCDTNRIVLKRVPSADANGCQLNACSPYESSR
jgi:hypothetical protein